MNLKIVLSVILTAATVATANAQVHFSGSPGKAITDRCSRRLVKGYLYKQSSDDSGAPREGKPALIFPRNKPNKNNLRVYARNGTVICYFKRYPGESEYGRRFYSGTGCGYTGAQIASAARSAAGSSLVYIEGPTNSCLGPLDPTKRKDTR